MTVRDIVRSRFTPVALPIAALVASLIRWRLQDSNNVYTAVAKRFYVEDPDLGWRVSTQHPIWLGLDACAALAALAIAIVVAGFIIRRRIRIASWILATASLAIPIAAFASGPGPLDARDTLPARAAVRFETGIEGSLDAPAGAYAVIHHAGTSVTAHLSAGGEAFDAAFADVTGSWDGDPRDFTRSMRADISVATASIDTGVDKRSKHAREGYLHADRFPRISVAIDRVTATRSIAPNEVAFRAPGNVSLMGNTHAVEITGTLVKPDATALRRLGLSDPVLLVRAELSLAIKDTALAPDAGDFDGDRIPIRISLVLSRRER